MNLKKKIVKELNRPARKNFQRLKMCVRVLNETWNADLIDMSSFADFNRDHRFILLIVDSLSKFIHCEAIKNKTANSVFQAFGKIKKKVKHIQKIYKLMKEKNSLIKK